MSINEWRGQNSVATITALSYRALTPFRLFTSGAIAQTSPFAARLLRVDSLLKT